MPTFALEVPETHDSITRPVTTGIVRDLINYLGLPNTTSVKYTGSAGESAQSGSVLAESGEYTKFPFQDKVSVDLEETYLEEGVLNTAVSRRDNRPIFDDPQLMVSLRPVYTKTEATLSLRYRATSEVQAQKWRDTIRRRMTQGMQALLHEVIYHYPVPAVFHAVMSEIHSKRELVEGYGETFEEWLRNHYDARMTVLSNLDGSRGIVAIPEKQIQVQGWLSFVTEPDKPEKATEGDTWVVGFDYTYQYDKPTAMVIDYPIVVHNQLLDDKFLNFEKPYNPYNVPRRPSYSGALNDAFSRINYNPEMAFQGVVVPEFDDWKPKGQRYRTVPLFTSLVGVELDDPCQVVNLLDLGDTTLTQPVINHLFRHRSYLTTYLASVFHITVYRGDVAQNGQNFYVDEDLNVRTWEPLSARDVNHVRVSLVTDLRNLSSLAKEALRRDPEVCTQVVQVIDGLQRPWLPLADSVGTHTKSDMINQSYPSIKRPGFHLPSGDYSHQRTKPSLPQKGKGELSKGEEEAKEEGRIWQPIKEVIDKTTHLPKSETLEDFINLGGVIVLTKGMENGREVLVVFLENMFYEIIVNHFLKETIIKMERVTVEVVENDLSNYLLIKEYPDLRDYIEGLLKEGETLDEIVQHPIVVDALDPRINVVIVNHHGVYKPTNRNSKPGRIILPPKYKKNKVKQSEKTSLVDHLDILGGKVVTLPSFELVTEYLKHDITLTKINHSRGMMTVMQAGIIAH